MREKLLPLNVQTRFLSSDIFISKTEEFIENYKSNFNDIRYCLVVVKELEIHAVDFEDTENITVNSVSLLPQGKQSGNENNKKKDHQVNPYGKMRLIRLQRKMRANKRKTQANKNNFQVKKL